MPTVSPSIGLFGKLPSHPDFIRHMAGGEAARRLDSWHSDGLAHLRRIHRGDWESRFDAAPPVQFVVQAESQHALVGVCAPSRDSTGRRYPISVFATIPVGRSNARGEWLPVLCGQFLNLVRRDLGAVLRAESGADLTQFADRLVPFLDKAILADSRSTPETIANATMQSFWTGIFGDFADRRKYVVIKNLFGVMVPLRGGDTTRLSAALNLPTGGDPDEAHVVSALWARLCTAVSGHPRLPNLSLFWRESMATPQRGECFIALRPPSVGLWCTVIAGSPANDSFLETDTPNDEPQAARSVLGERLASALDDPDLNMLAFIKRI